MAKQHDQLLKAWSASQKLLNEFNDANGAILTNESLHELLLASVCLRLLSNSFGDFESRCIIAAERNPLFTHFMEWRHDFETKFPNAIIPINDYGMNADDPFSVLMKLVAIISGQKANGVFYTPQPVASFTSAKALDRLNRITSDRQSISLLEPSIGSGVFIHEFLPLLKKHNFCARWQLLDVVGVDLSPAAILITEFLLADPDSRFNFDLRLSLFAGNTLTAELNSIYNEFEVWQSRKIRSNEFATNSQTPVEFASRFQTTFEESVRTMKYDLVVGNPPFAALTRGTNPWASELLHGRLSDEAGAISYFEVDGQNLGEKKTWLHDDYVKFLRYAHWQIDRNGSGCVALVLNSGFINNLTFRALRYQLAKSFDTIEVIDFGGDQRNRQDRNDENIFGIETGIAVLILEKKKRNKLYDLPDSELNSVRPNQCEWKSELTQTIQFQTVYGTIREKFDWCDRYVAQHGELQHSDLPPSPNVKLMGPKYRFDQSPSNVELSYEKGWCITEIFSKHWSAPVTARDHLIIDSSHEKLVERIESFLDPDKSDDEIRNSFFPNPRSSRYPKGDTRGWSLAKAREKLRQLDWKSQIIKCSYRPFDHRYILWMPEMIDWPRSQFHQQFSIPDNACFITRRQAPQDRDYDYFWMADRVPVDGIIRSDNRGNEYCFPKFILNPEGEIKLNLSDNFRQHLSDRLGVVNDQHQLVFDYCYGLAFCHAYRNHFKDELPQSFPRFFLPNNNRSQTNTLFESIADCGKRLRILHTRGFSPRSVFDEKFGVQRKRPKWKEGKLVFSCGQQIEVEEDVWSYRIGTHQVCRKLISNYWNRCSAEWLAERLGHVLDRIRRSIKIQAEIENVVEDHNGFERSFLP